MSISENEMLSLDSFSQLVQNLILSATENATASRATRICSTHFLLALLRGMDEEQGKAFQAGLEPGTQVRHVEEIIRTYTRPRSGASSPIFTGAVPEFSKCAQEALKFLEAFPNEGAEDSASSVPASDLSVLHVWVAVLSHPEADDTENLGDVLNFEKARDAFQKLIKFIPPQVPSLYNESTGEELRLEYFDETAIELLQHSVEQAGEMGYEKLMPAHIFMALISRLEGVGEWLVRRQAKPNVGPAKVVEEIEHNISLGFRGKPKTPELSKGCFSIPVQRALEEAFRQASRLGKKVIDESSLMYGVLVEESEGRVADILKLPSLEMDVRKMLHHLDQYIQEMAAGEESQQAAPFLLPKSLAKSEDLTFLAQIERLTPMVEVETAKNETPPIEQIKRGLHKRDNNHILITGQAGVGKTTIVRQLAWQIAHDKIPFLRRKKILWVDCAEINPEESREKLEQIIVAVKGRNDVIVCLDGFDAVIRYMGQRESNNLSMLKTALQNHHLHLIGVIQDRHYTELLGSEYQFLKFFTRVELAELNKEAALKVVEQLKPSLENTYGVQIEAEAIQKAVILSHDFILSERLPTKAIDTLEDACELASYDREMMPQNKDDTAGEKQAKLVVTPEHVIATVSQKTGVAESTLRGSGEAVDFEALLRSSVVGQDLAVEAVRVAAVND